MGSTSHNPSQLSDPNYRERTFTSSLGPLKIKPQDLAAAGFFSLQGREIQCSSCFVIIDYLQYSTQGAIDTYHIEVKPVCPRAVEAQQHQNNHPKALDSSPSSSSNNAASGSSGHEVSGAGSNSNHNNSSNINQDTLEQQHSNSPARRSRVECKGFNTFDSLRYERERLATFINWPVAWLKPETLAKEGFYYLHENDHCSCVFCRGVVGSWEPGDIPRREHSRHFPKCPFICSQPVGNIPIEMGDLLAALPIEKLHEDNTREDKTQQCRTHKQAQGCGSACNTALPSPKAATLDNPVQGLPVFSGPTRKEYITKEARLKTFRNWPNQVKQTPQALADAGFFYCGLSDHVRCYHCSNGLRNWEQDDDPWTEHARWYPDCTFVITTKGGEYVDQVRRVKPPYFRQNSCPSKQSAQVITTAPTASNSSPYVVNTYTSNVAANYRVRVSDEQLSVLMQLDVMQAALDLGFGYNAVRSSLRQKIQDTGVPFFSLETCTEAILTRSENPENEAQDQQEAKMSTYQREREERIHQSHENSLTVNAPVSEDEWEDVTPANTSPSRAVMSPPYPRTPIITSPVMPPRRERQPESASGSSTAVNSNITMQRTEQINPVPRDVQIRLGEITSEGSDIYSPEVTTPTSNEIETQTFEAMESEDIIEFPLIRNEGISYGHSEIHDRDVTPTNDNITVVTMTTSPDDTSTPRSSPSQQTFNSRLLPNSSINVEASSIPFSEASSSSMSTVADPISMEMLSQVDQIIEKQKRVCRNLSVGSTKSIGSNKGNSCGSVSSSVGEETGDSSDEGNTSMSDVEPETVEEQLELSKKRVASLQVKLSSAEEQLESLRDNHCCKVCMDAEVSVVFLPCTHMVTCASCTLSVEICPICRTRIVHAIKPKFL